MAKIKFPKKAKLRRFLLDLRSRGEKISLLNFTYFCRLLTRALAEDRRWKQYTRLCKEAGLSPHGQALAENILEHTGIDTPMLGGTMLAIERKIGTPLSYELLPVVFTIHDIPEGIALRGDVDYGLKKKEVDDEEDDAFALMVSLFDDEVRDYFGAAYNIVIESGTAKRAGVPLHQISLDAQFFTAVEIAGYLSRALYEVKVAGNTYFGQAFWNHAWQSRYFLHHFESFRRLVGPHVQYMEEFIRKNFNSEWNTDKLKIENPSLVG